MPDALLCGGSGSHFHEWVRMDYVKEYAPGCVMQQCPRCQQVILVRADPDLDPSTLTREA